MTVFIVIIDYIHSYYGITDSFPYDVLYILVTIFITGSLLQTSLLNSVSGWLFASLSFCSFSGVLPHSLTWDMCLCLSLADSLCFCMLGRFATSPGLGRAALCSKWPVVPSGSLPGHLNWVFWGVSLV